MKKTKIKFGIMGVGNRGFGNLRTLLTCPEADVVPMPNVEEQIKNKNIFGY